MATITQLTADLTSLLNEAKRRNTDIKLACELAITKLKNYQPQQPVDQLTGQDKSVVLKPFLISCNTNNARFANLAIPAIHKLIIFNGIGSPDLAEILKSLLEATHLAIDIQLRILQCLPSLMQNYSYMISGQLLLNLLTICASLTSNNKSTVVINTASATLQQLFSNIYDKVPVSNDTVQGTTNTVTIDEEKTIVMDDLSYEGFLIFQDLCKITDNDSPEYFKSLTQIKFNSILEIIENIISSHKELFNNHQELSYLLRIKLIPSLLRLLNHNKTFPLTIRTMRILLVLLNSQLDNLIIEGEIVLSILNHILLNNDLVSSTPDEGEVHTGWQKYLVLEIFKGLFSNFSIIKKIYELYDMNPKKKNVIKELFSILSTYLQKNPILIRDIIMLPSPQPTGESVYSGTHGSNNLYLSKQTSMIKISVLDLLDKTDPPSNIPATYPIYLIFNILLSFTDGIAKFVNNLSNNSPNLDVDIDFINNLIESTYSDTSQLFKLFIYSLMDNEHFRLLIRSLQKFTHTTGLLSLNTLRDGLMTLLAECIIKQETSTPSTDSNNSTDTLTTGLREQGKNLLAFGESIVESLTNSELNLTTTTNANDLKITRNYNFNSRHVTCLRALINLAVSLGSTLHKSWRIVWITLQWCDYYVNGLNEFSGIKKNEDRFNTKLTQQDINNIQNSILDKFYESINEYPIESYEELIDSLIELFELGTKTGHTTTNGLIPCPYNKVFFIDKLFDICLENLTQYLVQKEDIFTHLSQFFIKFGIHNNEDSQDKLNGNFNFKKYIIVTFTNIIRVLSLDSSKIDDLKTFNNISKMCLNGLDNLILELNNISYEPQELLIINNNKIEIHLIILETLNELMESYNKSLTIDDSWDIIFRIINNPFEFNKLDDINDTLKDKINSLVNSSFNCLKLILNQLISTLPITKFKMLIDTLFNFGIQTNDLNISFSSISYYWLISDSIKSKFQASDDTSDFPQNEEQLVKNIDKIQLGEASNTSFYKSLDIYLLLSLIKLSGDSRAQVRDGSIQTFFEIIDIHGNLFNAHQWELIYNIVLINFFSVNDQLSLSELKQTATLKLDGLIGIYSKFCDYFQVKFWHRLMEYLNDLIKLNKLEINIIILKKFNLLLAIDPKNNTVNEYLFEFWNGIPIEYDFNDPDLYIEQLENLMIDFSGVYDKISSSITVEKVQMILNNFTKILRYPIILHRMDNIQASFLQSKIIDNIKLMGQGQADEINSVIIRELSNILIYQFKIRERIENKLSNSNLKQKYKLPTFISIGNLAFGLIKEKLAAITNIEILVKDRTIIRLLNSNLEIIRNKTIGNNSTNPIWIESNEMVTQILERIIHQDIDEEIWELILQAININFSNNHTKAEESINITQYHKLIHLILPHLKHQDIITKFLNYLYLNSYLYEFNELEQELLVDTEQIDQVIDNLISYNFNNSFGSTKPISFYKFNHIKLMCLKELINYTNYNDVKFQSVAIKYFIARLSFTIRRLIEDEKLIYKMPISTIQKQELTLLLRGLLGYINDHYLLENYQLLKGLVNLLIKFMPYSKFQDVNEMVEQIMMRFNSLK